MPSRPARARYGNVNVSVLTISTQRVARARFDNYVFGDDNIDS
jgi:hypothetical protein